MNQLNTLLMYKSVIALTKLNHIYKNQPSHIYKNHIYKNLIVDSLGKREEFLLQRKDKKME